VLTYLLVTCCYLLVSYLLVILVDDGPRSNALIAHILPMPIQHVLEGIDGVQQLSRQSVPLVKSSLTEAILS